MSSIISEIVKITVDPGFTLDSPAFARLRKSVVQGGVKEQYYGIDTDEPTNLFWVIQWPADMNPAEYKGSGQSEDFRESVKGLDVNYNPTSWYIPFDDAEKPRSALTAALCQICALHMNSTAKREAIADSLHKTFTDCYYAPGFSGGYWGAANNDDRLNCYYLGWETRELHDDFAKTDLFALELNKLWPHMDGGWSHYMKMTQEMN